MTSALWKQADQNEQYRIMNSLVKERIFPESTIVTEKDDELDIQFHAHVLKVKLERVAAFKRYQLTGAITYAKGNQTQQIDSTEQLIDILTQHFDIPIDERLNQELISSRDGFVSVYRVMESRASTVKASLKYARLPLAINFFSWLQHMADASQLDPLLYSESLAVEGHPTHPLSKTKLPLTEEEVAAYSPEFEKTIPLKLMLIHKDYAGVTSPVEDTQMILNQVIPDYRYKLRAFIEPLGLSLDDYYVIFVHPWQYEHVILHDYIEWIDRQILLPTPYNIDSKATLSFRTMDLVGRPYHIKLPVNIQMTSAVRTVGPVTTVDGPRLSYQLQGLFQRFPHMQIAKEPYGIYAHTEDDRARQLACIVREKPTFTQNGISVVSASLVNRNPVDQQVIVDSYLEWLREDVTPQTIQRFITEYARQLVRPLIAYIQHYGVALEAHMQNTVVNLGPHYEMTFLIRDLGGARLDLVALQQALHNVEITNTSLIAKDMEAVIQKFQHSVIQNQFGELIYHFTQYEGVEERALYSIVAEQVREAIDDDAPHAQILKDVLFGPTITVKALMRMRMKQQVKQYETITLPNPLGEEDDSWRN